MHWIESAGGPLVAVPSRDLAAWHGGRAQYGAASEIEDVGLLQIPGSEGPLDVLVLWDEPMATAFLAELGLVVQWRYGDDEDSLLALVSEQAESADWEQAAELELGGEVTLFDAAEAGADAEATLAVSWPAGAGVVEVAEVEDDQNAAKILRFRVG